VCYLWQGLSDALAEAFVQLADKGEQGLLGSMQCHIC
jgi:hypothetical protein